MLSSRLDVEVAPDRVRERLVLVGAQVAQQAVGGEHGQPGILERHQAHQHVALGALAADLLGVHARGLVAVVAVGDQQLDVLERLVDRRRSWPDPSIRHRRLTVPSSSVAWPQGRFSASRGRARR